MRTTSPLVQLHSGFWIELLDQLTLVRLMTVVIVNPAKRRRVAIHFTTLTFSTKLTAIDEKCACFRAICYYAPSDIPCFDWFPWEIQAVIRSRGAFDLFVLILLCLNFSRKIMIRKALWKAFIEFRSGASLTCQPPLQLCNYWSVRKLSY